VFLLADVVVLSLRALGVLAVFHAAGIMLFLSVFGANLERGAELLQRIVRMAAIAGVVITGLEYFLLPARMAGSIAGAFDDSLRTLLAESPIAGAYGARVAGLGLLLLSLEMRDRARLGLGAAGAVVVLASFGLMGHTAIHPYRWSAGMLLVLHVGIAGVWFGALIPLYVLVGAETRATTAAVLDRFSATASWLVAGFAICGVVLLGLMLANAEELASGYGVMVMGKIVGFALLLRLAAGNRWRWSPGIRRGDPGATEGLQRSLAIEWLLMMGVIALTVVMTSLYSPALFSGGVAADSVLH
jgi:putative copper export protein